MPDIFGREAEDYTFVRALRQTGAWEAYQRQEAARRPGTEGRHSFDALAAGVPRPYTRASEDLQAVGYLTNNLLAIQTMIDEILYTSYRLPNFIHLNTAIPEGARSYGIRVRDRVGRAVRITGPGFDAPSATAGETIVTQDIHWYGLDAEWSIDELRGAMLAGHPLDAESIDAAVTGTLETMEAVGLTGGGYAEMGLLNLPITGDDAVTHRFLSVNFATGTPLNTRDIINATMSRVIEDSKETLGTTINSGMTVYLPGVEYDALTTRYIGDNARYTLMESMLQDNPWTHFAGTPISFQRVQELAGMGQNGTNRMIVALKHGRVAEMGVSISPRVLTIMNKGRVVCAQVEAKFSPLFVKRPNTIHYVDNI